MGFTKKQKNGIIKAVYCEEVSKMASKVQQKLETLVATRGTAEAVGHTGTVGHIDKEIVAILVEEAKAKTKKKKETK